MAASCIWDVLDATIIPEKNGDGERSVNPRQDYKRKKERKKE